MASSSTAELWDAIADEAARESRLWGDALLPAGQRERAPIFSPLAEPRFALGLETIYEGYLLHFGRPRLFVPKDADDALLLGDYLYAHGLVRVAAVDPLAAVADLAELISLCSQVRAEKRDGDGAVWAATSAALGRGTLDDARSALRLRRDPSPLEALAREAAGDEAVERALAAHAARLG